MIKKHALPVIIAVILATLLALYLSAPSVPDCRLARSGGRVMENNVFILNGNGD